MLMMNFSDGTRESSIVTKVFLVEQAFQRESSSDAEVPEELLKVHIVSVYLIVTPHCYTAVT